MQHICSTVLNIYSTYKVTCTLQYNPAPVHLQYITLQFSTSIFAAQYWTFTAHLRWPAHLQHITVQFSTSTFAVHYSTIQYQHICSTVLNIYSTFQHKRESKPKTIFVVLLCWTGWISMRGPLNTHEQWKIVPYKRSANDVVRNGDLVRVYYGYGKWLRCDCGDWCEISTCPGTQVNFLQENLSFARDHNIFCQRNFW